MPGSTPKKFKLEELEKATLNFHHSNKIGYRYYRGTLTTKWGMDTHSKKMEVAIKNLSGLQAKNRWEWIREINILEEIDHPNLVKVLGYCAKGSKKKKFEMGRYFLVNEFTRNGSVHDHLSNYTLHGPISWEARLRIARDAARALAYLHGRNIVHKQFDSSVVLLDEKFNVKVADYLVSRLGPIHERDDDDFNVQEISVHGPPLFMGQYGSRPESDTWSFGVFLCELITGKDQGCNAGINMRREGDYAKYVEQNFSNSEQVKAIVDPRLRGRYDLERAQEMANIAKMCLRKEPDFRPSMKTVVSMLTGVA